MVRTGFECDVNMGVKSFTSWRCQLPKILKTDDGVCSMCVSVVHDLYLVISWPPIDRMANVLYDQHTRMYRYREIHKDSSAKWNYFGSTHGSVYFRFVKLWISGRITIKGSPLLDGFHHIFRFWQIRFEHIIFISRLLPSLLFSNVHEPQSKFPNLNGLRVIPAIWLLF